MFKGSIAALVTPFTVTGEIDYEVLSQLIEWHIEQGTDAIVLCGITGEAPVLTSEETLDILKQGVLVSKGRIPIIAGTGSLNTSQTVQMTQAAKEIGVDAALVIVPYYNRPGPEGCYLHFQAVDRVGLPLVIYHHPGRTGLKLPVKTLAQISRLSSVVGTKESSGDLDYTIEFLHQSSKPVFAGDDGLIIPILASGGAGVISVMANLVPEQWARLAQLLLEGNLEEARVLFQKYYPLCKSMFLETNPQCVKYALSLMKKCRAELRLPLVEPREEIKKQILFEMKNLDLIQKTIQLEGTTV